LSPNLTGWIRPCINIDGSSIPSLLLTHDLYDGIQYERFKIASLFFLLTVAFHLFLMMAYA